MVTGFIPVITPFSPPRRITRASGGPRIYCATWGNFQTVAAGQDEMQFVTNGQTLYALTRGFRYASTNSGANMVRRNQLAPT